MCVADKRNNSPAKSACSKMTSKRDAPENGLIKEIMKANYNTGWIKFFQHVRFSNYLMRTVYLFKAVMMNNSVELVDKVEI